MSNAVKFTDQGNISLGVNLLSTSQSYSEIEFIIKDTGIGIAADQLESIFESFVQAGDDMVKRSGGTGLGLTITKRLVEMQGGWLVVASESSKGTTFHFVLRYAHTHNSEDNNISVVLSGEDDALRGRRVLLVEDNLVNQKVTYHLLTKAGLSVEIAGDGKQAIRILENGSSYDVILLDLQMPEMDGFQVTAYLRNKLKLDIPVIAMTASVLRNEKAKCFEVGMDGYLPKPFAPEELFSNLRHFLFEDGMHKPAAQHAGYSSESYDLSYIKEMEDPAYTAEVLGIFLETTPVALSDLKKCSLAENWTEVAKAAHKLKSSVGLMQMKSILANVEKVEIYAMRKEHLDEIPRMVKHIAGQYELIRPMLEAELEEAKNEIDTI